MKADHFEQQKLLALAAEDVALTQLSHRRRTLPEVAAVEVAAEAERTFAEAVVRAETEVRDLDREQKRLEADVDTVRQREDKDQRLLDSGSVSPKEMTNLQHELASLKRRQSDLEDQVLELMERREAADAALAAARMSRAYASVFGTPICVTDSYRTYSAQVDVYARKPTLAAVPGSSNHGWGVALDLCDGVQSFGTKQHVWMQQNAMAFGWFHPAWAQAGGSKPEPWHWEYAG